MFVFFVISGGILGALGVASRYLGFSFRRRELTTVERFRRLLE